MNRWAVSAQDTARKDADLVGGTLAVTLSRSLTWQQQQDVLRQIWLTLRQDLVIESSGRSLYVALLWGETGHTEKKSEHLSSLKFPMLKLQQGSLEPSCRLETLLSVFDSVDITSQRSCVLFQ
jgi:hypothetical protein